MTVSGEAIFSSLVFRQNLSEGAGGAIFTAGQGAGSFFKLILQNNIANLDSGGLVRVGLAGLLVANSKLQGNVVLGNGGGIFNDGASPDIVLHKTQVSGNFAQGTNLTLSGANFSGSFSGVIAPTVKAPKTIYRVNSLSDAVDPNHGDLTLREAILAANSAGKPASIGFAADLQGTVVLTSAFPTVTTSLRLLGNGVDRVGISGSGMYRILELNQSGGVASVLVSNLALLGGAAPGSGGLGGAIWNRGENLTVSGVVFNGNYAHDEGGAIFQEGGSLSVQNSSITQSYAGANGAVIAGTVTDSLNMRNLQMFANSSTSTGGFHLELASSGKAGQARIEEVAVAGQSGRGGFLQLSSPAGATFTLKNSIFAANQYSGTGGGLSLLSNTTGTARVLIEGSVFAHQYATAAGGLHAYLSSNSTLTLKNTDFFNNQTTTENVGGAWLTGPGKVFWQGGTVAANYAKEHVGGVALSGDVTAKISNLTIAGNRADENGGGVAVTGTATAVSFDRMRLVGNSAGEDGGALAMSGESLAMRNSIVSGNRSGGDGGAIYASGDGGAIQVQATNLQGNKGSSKGGGIYSEGYNLSLSAGRIAANLAASGAGLVFVDGSASYSAVLKGTTFAANAAFNSSGGALRFEFFESSSSASLTKLQILRNSSISANAGGVFVEGGSLKVSSSIFSQNYAANEVGALYFGSGASYVLDGKTSVTANLAPAVAGGLRAEPGTSGGGPATIAGNSAALAPNRAEGII